MASSIKSVLIGGIEQHHDILRRNTMLDIVDIVKDVAATGLELSNVVTDMLPDFLRTGKGQYMLGVDATAPEDDTVAELLLQP